MHTTVSGGEGVIKWQSRAGIATGEVHGTGIAACDSVATSLRGHRYAEGHAHTGAGGSGDLKFATGEAHLAPPSSPITGISAAAGGRFGILLDGPHVTIIHRIDHGIAVISPAIAAPAESFVIGANATLKRCFRLKCIRPVGV